MLGLPSLALPEIALPKNLRALLAGALLALGLWTGLAAAASAQTISQPVGSTTVGPAVFYGTSFTATVTGTVTAIRVRPRSTEATILYLYNGSNTGAFFAAGAFVSSQPVNLVDTGDNTAGFNTFTLLTPLPVVAGNTYAFAFGSGTFARSQQELYPGGAAFIAGTIPELSDATFEVVQVAAAPVPTLSEWAMILLGLALAGAAAFHLQRRQVAA
jgi:hypothetical protein